MTTKGATRGARLLLPCAAALLLFVGCDDAADNERDDTAATSAAATASAAPGPSASGGTRPGAGPAAPSASPTASPSAPEGDLEGALGKRPARHEWESVTETVAVQGGAGLVCEAKTARGWLRVFCKKPQPQARPTTIETKKGVLAQTFTTNEGGGLSVVFPLAEGVDVEAALSWTTDRRVLTVVWPEGAPEVRVMVTDEPTYDSKR